MGVGDKRTVNQHTMQRGHLKEETRGERESEIWDFIKNRFVFKLVIKA